MSPTTAQQTMSYAPPLLRLAGIFLCTGSRRPFEKITDFASLTTRCPSPSHILPRFQHHTNPRRPTARSSSAGITRPRGGSQLYRVVPVSKRDSRIRCRRLAGLDLGSHQPNDVVDDTEHRTAESSEQSTRRLASSNYELAVCLRSWKYQLGPSEWTDRSRR